MVHEDKDFKQFLLPDWEPMEFNQDGGYMLMLPVMGNGVGSGSDFQMVETLSLKNEIKSLVRAEGESWAGRMGSELL